VSSMSFSHPVPASVATPPPVAVPVPAPSGQPRAPQSSRLYRLWLGHAPRPRGVGRRRVMAVLDPRPGERIVEIGPGGGYNSVPIARAIGPAGSLMLVDHDTAMLDATLQRLRAKGLRARAGGSLADASRRLPFGDAAYDAAVLVAVLGEVADPALALAEAARVVRPGGRVVLGEVRLDPHAIAPDDLRALAVEAGLRPEGTFGGFSYTVRLRRP
jgi:ubiquinone/menaquinone biosynthesis C-methylase UbiE